MENLTKELKQEILNAISDLEINSYDFEHFLENGNISTAKNKFYIEKDNFSIELELRETVKWFDYDYDKIDLEVLDYDVTVENGKLDLSNLTENEILKNLNY